jgi:hypothetical protein
MDNLSLSSTFTFGPLPNTTGSGTADNVVSATPIWDTTIYQPLVQAHYYNWYPYWTNEDKISKAFKLAQVLIEKKLIKEPEKVKDFIELVNVLVEIV